MNRLPLVLITLATVSALAPCARAQTPTPLVVPESEASGESRSAPEAVEGAGAEKAELRFEGLSFLKDETARGELRDEYLITKKSPLLDPARIDDAVRVLKKFYTRYGFLSASFEVREEQPGARPRLFTIVVDEGERARLEEIRFEGGRGVNGVRLEEATGQCLGRMREEDEDWRDAYDYELLEWCVRDARGVLFDDGWLEAKVGEPKVEALGRGVRATVRFEEGLRYRRGRIKVIGATAFLPEQIVDMLEMREGEVVNGGKFTKVLAGRLEGEYADRGFIQFSYEVTPSYRQTPKRKGWGVADFKIYITEGKSFTFSSISFTGNRLKTVDELRAALSVREGDVFNCRRFQEGLERLAEIGAMGNVVAADYNSWPNVNIEKDEEKSSVSVSIQIREVEY